MPDDDKMTEATSDNEKADDEAGKAKETPDEKGASAAPELTQEEIARRVAALSTDEDELARVAEEEERKLRERRAKLKKKGKKGPLDEAASKRLAKIAPAKSPVKALPLAVDADPLMERAANLNKWVKKNQRTVGIGVAAVVLALAAIGGHHYTEQRKEAQASAALALAVEDQQGRIGDPDKEEETDRPRDPTPMFRTTDERRDAALGKFRDIRSKFPRSGAAILARLAEGSLLLDKGDADGAIAAFNEVRESPLGKADLEVRGRALEGSGFAYELKAAHGPDGARFLDDAQKVFRELETTDVKGFKELGMYHSARVLEAKGERDKARDTLKSLYARVTKPEEAKPFFFLEPVVEERLRALDPEAVPMRDPGRLRQGAGGKKQLTEAQLKQLLDQLQKSGGAPAPDGKPPTGAPPAPAPVKK